MVVQQTIELCLTRHYAPIVMQVENESHRHNVPPDSETHFKVVLVSDQFEGKRQVARHQGVYRVLADVLAGPVHALALHTYTPAEWEARQKAPESPDCLGGSGR